MLALPAQIVFVLDAEQASDGFLDARPRNLPRPYGLHNGIIRVGLLLRRTGDYEQVSPRPDGLDGSIGHGSFARGPRHGEIVRDDHAVEAKIVTQLIYGIPRKTCGTLGVYGRVHEMPDHYHGHPGVDGGREWR